MVDNTVVANIKSYLKALPAVGIHPLCAVLFGSFARGEAHQWSDIDLVVIAPEFDREFDHTVAEDLWEARTDADIRIEPVPCGEREWEEDDSRPILEIARREGIVITSLESGGEVGCRVISGDHGKDEGLRANTRGERGHRTH